MMGEAGIRDCFCQQLSDVKEAISEQGRLRGAITVFYLLGPFFMLIERSPADAWLTLCGLIFLVRCMLKRDWCWTRFFWVRAVLLFWVWCLGSALSSKLPMYSFGEAAVWIRFPFFAFASAFWLARDPRILMGMLISMGLGMLIMSGILFAEFFIVGNEGRRLEWPYGDATPGNYLAKACLPIFCVLVAIAVSVRERSAGLAALLSLVTILASVLTGERINLILRVFAGMLAGLVCKPIASRFLLLLGIIASTFAALLLWRPMIRDRFVSQFVAELPLNNESSYWRAWSAAMDAFASSPLKGIGPDNYRLLCPSISSNNLSATCFTHPHNYYIQILAETGIIGFILASLMIASIIWCCFKCNLTNRQNVLAATCFIVPFGLFFPLQSTSDFFGQWNNTFMWSAIAFSLAVAHQTLRQHASET